MGVSFGVRTETFEIKAGGKEALPTSTTDCDVTIESNEIVFKSAATEVMRIKNYSLSNGNKTLTGTYVTRARSH